MFTAYVIVAATTAAANLAAAGVDFFRAKFVLANMAELGIPESWLPSLGTLKAAGGLGLLVGLLGVRFIGVAAEVGLVLYFIGAVAAHLRAQVYPKLVFPGGFLALAVASLLLSAAR